MSEHTVKQLAKLAALSATMLATALPANAQTTADSSAEEIQLLREQIKLLQQRLDAIEQREAEQSAATKAAAITAAQNAVAAARTEVAKPTPAPTDVTATINNKGITLSTADKKYTFSVRPRIQADGHFFPDTDDGTNEFYMRRLLLSFRGTAGFVGWRFTPNFAGANTTTIDDAWIELNNLLPDSTLTAGKITILDGLENAQSNACILFIERGLPSTLVPGRGIGVKFTGTLAEKRLEYGLSLTNGALDGTSMNNNAALSDEKTFTASLRVKPFATMKESALADFSFGMSVAFGQVTTTLDGTTDKSIKYKTAGRNTFISVNNGVLVDDDRLRLNPNLMWYYGSFGFLSEYVSSDYTMVKGAKSYDVTNSAWTAQASYVLTGEKASFAGVKPSHPFTINGEGWGAFELGARYNRFDGDEALFDGGLVSSSSAQKARAWGIAAKWYLTENLLWALNFENTEFSGKGADRDTEQAVITRLQIDF
jgi:phosphate-selective porin OprO/OprP